MKILLVDDSVEINRSLKRVLAAVPGVESVDCAEDIAGAIETIEARPPDVIVLDIQLRGTERGMDLLQHVRSAYPGMQVAMLSNFNWDAMRVGFMEAGACAYFDKGSGVADLRRWIVERVGVDTRAQDGSSIRPSARPSGLGAPSARTGPPTEPQ